jgi:dTDP-4-amino-4,6-dideoxygalactose transaminase
VIRYAPAPGLWRMLAAALREHAVGDSARDGLLFFPSAQLQLLPSAREAIRRLLVRLPRKGTVLIPAFTCMQVVEAVRAAGHEARFVDTDPASGVVTPTAVAAAITGDCRAVLVSHLFTSRVDVAGVVAAVAGRAEVIEDSALVRWPGQGLAPGTSALVLSMGRGKPLGIGAGGACIVPDGQPLPSLPATPAAVDELGLVQLLASAVSSGSAFLALGRLLGRCGALPAVHEAVAARLLRPSELSAAARRAIANRMHAAPLAAAAAHAAALAEHYRAALDATAGETLGWLHDGLACPPGGLLTPALPVAVPRRDDCLRALRRAGFDIPAYWRYSAAQAAGDGACPVSERLARTLLYLPLHEGVRPPDVEAMADIIARQSRA